MYNNSDCHYEPNSISRYCSPPWRPPDSSCYQYRHSHVADGLLLCRARFLVRLQYKISFLIWNTKLSINFASSLLRQTDLRHTLWNTTQTTFAGKCFFKYQVSQCRKHGHAKTRQGILYPGTMQCSYIYSSLQHCKLYVFISIDGAKLWIICISGKLSVCMLIV